MNDLKSNVLIDIPATLNFNVATGIGTACFDDLKTKRYFLEKRWDSGSNILTAFMMNPSNADEVKSDNTINFMIKFAKHNGYEALYVINMSPVIKSKSKNLVAEDFNLSCESLYWIEYAIHNSQKVILAWGKKGQEHIRYLLQNTSLKQLLRQNQSKLYAFEFGINPVYPNHPCRNGIEVYSEDSILKPVENNLFNSLFSIRVL